jgi:hypothetical protein
MEDFMDNKNEWDELIENVSDKPKTELNTNNVIVNSNANNFNQTQPTNNFNLRWIIGVGGIIVFFIFVILPMLGGGGGGGGGTYRLKNSSFEQNSTTNYEYYAIIENTSSQTHSYRDTLEIYTPSGSLYDSISDYYTLQAGGTDTVWFFVNVPAGYYGSYKVKVTVT